MAAIVSLLVVVTLSLIVTRVASVALMLTGLSQQSARFQARSAFTGAGFTTAESENVVNHPVRRRIVAALMLLGNAGLVSGAATLLLGFISANGTGQGAKRAGVLVLGLALLVGLSRTPIITRLTELWIERALRRFTRLDARDYAGLLRLSGKWRVIEMAIDPEDWLADRPLRDLDLPEEGILVLGIERKDGRYIGAPTGDTCIRVGDTVLLYGREKILADLDERRQDMDGAMASSQARLEHQEELTKQKQEDRDAAEETADSAAAG